MRAPARRTLRLRARKRAHLHRRAQLAQHRHRRAGARERDDALIEAPENAVVQVLHQQHSDKRLFSHSIVGA